MRSNFPDFRELRDSRERFAALLEEPETTEATWQRFFGECPYVLANALPLELLPQDIVPLGRPGRAEPDLIFYPRHTPPRHPSYGVIELKRLEHKIFTKQRSNVFTLSRNAATAVGQGRKYLSELEEGKIVKPRTDVLFLGTSAYVFIIMGLSTELQRTLVTELLGAELQSLLPPSFQILPYDYLFRMFEASIPARFLAMAPLGEEESNDEVDADEDDLDWGYMGPSHEQAYEDEPL